MATVKVKLGDTIGLINKVLFNMKDNRTNYWRLSEGKVKSIALNRKGRRVKADHFYTLDAEDIEDNTKWLLENDRLILTCEPFILTEELRQRVEMWIERENAQQEKGGGIMAEFVEVCREYDRMCSHFENCGDCPFSKRVVQCLKMMGNSRYITEEHAKAVEELIMTWAAENPELVYPTWEEVLSQFAFIERSIDENGNKHTRYCWDKPIPADIAQKLGIEPKECT